MTRPKRFVAILLVCELLGSSLLLPIYLWGLPVFDSAVQQTAGSVGGIALAVSALPAMFGSLPWPIVLSRAGLSTQSALVWGVHIGLWVNSALLALLIELAWTRLNRTRRVRAAGPGRAHDT